MLPVHSHTCTHLRTPASPPTTTHSAAHTFIFPAQVLGNPQQQRTVNREQRALAATKYLPLIVRIVLYAAPRLPPPFRLRLPPSAQRQRKRQHQRPRPRPRPLALSSIWGIPFLPTSPRLSCIHLAPNHTPASPSTSTSTSTHTLVFLSPRLRTIRRLRGIRHTAYCIRNPSLAASRHSPACLGAVIATAHIQLIQLTHSLLSLLQFATSQRCCLLPIRVVHAQKYVHLTSRLCLRCHPLGRVHSPCSFSVQAVSRPLASRGMWMLLLLLLLL